MNRKRRDLLGLLLLLPGLAACGVKGAIQEPEGQESSYVYPRTYPDPKTVVPSGGTAAPPPPGIPADSFGSERRTTTVIESE